MATPISWAQDVITCDLCDNSTQQFCNSCQVSLCVKCVSRHVKKFKFQTHDIVPFTKRIVQLVFPDCETHTNKRCEARCKQCDVPVCLKCMLGSHNGHKYEDISEIFNKKKKDMKKETREIECTIIPQYIKKNKEAENQLSIAITKFDEMDKKRKEYRVYWHQEVDTIFNKVGFLLRAKKENHLDALKSHQSKIKDQIPDMIHTVEQSKEILKSNNVSVVTNYKSKFEEYRDMPNDIQMPLLRNNIVQGRELSLELEEYKAILQQISLSGVANDVYKTTIREQLNNARVVFTIPTELNILLHVVCVGVDEAWVSGGEKAVRRIDIHGSVRDTVTTTCQSWPDDITVTRQGDLVYSKVQNSTVNIVRHGRTKPLILTPSGWHSDKICCTMSGDILISMYTSDYSQRKIVRYQKLLMKQEIDKDEDGKPIYKEGRHSLCVVENNNGDICSSDGNADTVVVVNKSGKVRFRYEGKPAGRDKSFHPVSIVTDSMGHIIVADKNNACLHILDQNGEFLGCVDKCGLDGLCGLSVGSKGRLWVWLSGSEKVKVIQYMK